jgi:hypothetical protein
MSELPKGFVSASHAVLFDDAEKASCDVCQSPLPAPEDVDAGDPLAGISGRGLLVWARGEERRYQEPPLCPSCAAAIGLTALSRWEIEEEEG